MNYKILLLAISIILSLGLSAQFGNQLFSNNDKLRSGEETAIASKDLRFDGTRPAVLPLYTIDLLDFKLPITLSYDHTGVKIADIASWVGLKWTLNAGGKITREVKSLPDESEGGRMLYPNMYSSIKNLINENSHQKLLNSFYHSDLEADIFSFEFNGTSGKFFIDSGEVRLIPFQNIKIEPYISSLPYNQISLDSFRITDEAGTQYFFSSVDEDLFEIHGDIFEDYSNPYGYNIYDTTRYKAAWHLTQVVLPMGNIINFFYSDEDYTQFHPPVTKKRGVLPYSQDAFTATSIRKYSKRLNRIENENIQILFQTQDNQRLDLQGAYALDKVTVYYKPTMKKIKEFSFKFHYYGNNQFESFSYGAMSLGDTNRRLMLDTIYELSTDPNRNGKKLLYSFEYDESRVLPAKYSMQKDLWGYYNANQSPNYGFPTIYINPNKSGLKKFSVFNLSNHDFTLEGADRFPNPDVITLGSLKRINFETGGYKRFEYECNDFNYEGYNFKGFGLRLRKTTLFDGVDESNNIITTYTYRSQHDTTISSGSVFNLPVFASVENSHGYMAGYDFLHPSHYAQDEIEFYQRFLTISSDQINHNGSGDIDFGYSEINEHFGDGSRIHYRFSVPGRYNQQNDTSDCDEYNGYCDSLFKRSTTYYCIGQNSTGQTPDLKGIDTLNNPIPFNIGINYDWNRGLLLEKTFLNSNQSKVQKHIFKYKLYYPKFNNKPYYIAGLKFADSDNWKLDSLGGTVPAKWPLFSPVIFFSRYENIANVSKVLDSSIVVTYAKDDTIRTLSQVTAYEYGGYLHCSPTLITTVDSKGNIHSKELTYAFDLLKPGNLPRSQYNKTNAPHKGFLGLLAKHNNALIFERDFVKPYGSVQEFQTFGKYTDYDGDLTPYCYCYDDFGLVVPLTRKIFNNDSPTLKTPISNFVDNINGGYLTDNNYGLQYVFGPYNSAGRLLTEAKYNKLNSYIWGYNNQYPIATVTNATHNAIAYTSFETSDKGNWVYDQSNIVYDTSSPMGTYAYLLGPGKSIYFSLTNPIYNTMVTYWGKNGPYSISGTDRVNTGATVNGWTYYEHEIGYSTSLKIASFNGLVDELRLYPKGSKMTTYVYNPLIGVSASCNEQNKISHFEYDEYGRLISIRDSERNILKAYQYKNTYED